MTYPGYISLGQEDPFAVPPTETVELVNNERAYAYAANAGLDWLLRCDECPEAAVIVPGGPDFASPTLDPAPWYDEDNPDSWGFLGVLGLEITGVEDSTRQATVTMALTGGGVIGPTYMAPRTMVIRALAIASDECALSFGLGWLRSQYNTEINPCGGDPMVFFDCCPCSCDDDTPGGPCWAINYFELRTEPSCMPDWWPATYLDLKVGPPDEDEQWCSWPEIYRRLRTGPPSWSCCIDACVVPYMRQFRNSRVTAGPTVLRHPKMNNCGALAEIEFTIVAADPEAHAPPFVTSSGMLTQPVLYEEVPEVTAARVDPFARGATMLLAEPEVVAEPTQWARHTMALRRDPRGMIFASQRPQIRLTTREATGPVRLGLWAGDQRLGGWSVPFLPANTIVYIDGESASALVDGEHRPLPAFVRGWSETDWSADVVVPFGEYTLTVDQKPEEAQHLLVHVSMVPVER